MTLAPDTNPVNTVQSDASAASPAIEGGIGLTRHSRDFASAVVATGIMQGPTETVEVLATRAELLSAAGDVVGGMDVVLENRPEDVGGVIAHSEYDGEMYVYGLECLRPALSVRQHLGLPALGGTEGNRVLGEIGGYLVKADGVTHGAEQILAAKTNLHPVGPFEYLGNLVTPNPAVSAELSIPSAVAVRDPGVTESIVAGDKFESSRAVVRLKAQEVVARFFAGKLSDPRWVLDIMEQHANMREAGELTHELVAPSILKAELGDRLEAGRSKPNVAVPLLSTPGEVLEFMNQRPQGREVQSVSLGKFQPVPENALYRTYRLAVENRNAAGEVLGQAYGADAVIRQYDMLNIIVLAKVGDTVYMPVNIGVRPALACRDRSPRVVHTITEERNLEGITGSLKADWSDRSRVCAQVRAIVERLTGHSVAGEPMLTAVQGYWSPGFNATGFRVALAVIQLDEKSAERLPKNTALVCPEALLDANVRDLPLRLAAGMATLLLDQRESRQMAFSPGERPGIRQLMASPSQVDAFIREHSQELLDVKRRHLVVSNILNKRLGAGGLLIERPDPGDPEKYFFNSLMQTFVVHAGDHPLRIGQLLIHDSWHYEHPDPLPFRMEGGRLMLDSFERYRSAVMSNEIDAVMFSDVVLPEIFGVASFEREMGAASLASLLRASGIEDRDAQRDAVAFALEHGELPEPIVRFLHDSGMFAKYEPVIREKLLGYYVRDYLKNVKLLYDAWATMPDVADLALSLGARRIDERRSEPVLFSHRVTRLITEADGTAVHTGRNPLREALGFAKTYGVYQPALRLAYIKAHLDPDVHQMHIATINMATTALIKAHADLEKAGGVVKSIEESPTNAAAYRLYLRIQKNIIEPTKLLIEQLESESGPLKPAQREQLKAHRHAPFPILSFDPRQEADAQRQVSNLIRTSYAKAGLPCPALD